MLAFHDRTVSIHSACKHPDLIDLQPETHHHNDCVSHKNEPVSLRYDLKIGTRRDWKVVPPWMHFRMEWVRTPETPQRATTTVTPLRKTVTAPKRKWHESDPTTSSSDDAAKDVASGTSNRKRKLFAENDGASNNKRKRSGQGATVGSNGSVESEEGMRLDDEKCTASDMHLCHKPLQLGQRSKFEDWSSDDNEEQVSDCCRRNIFALEDEVCWKSNQTQKRSHQGGSLSSEDRTTLQNRFEEAEDNCDEDIMDTASAWTSRSGRMKRGENRTSTNSSRTDVDMHSITVAAMGSRSRSSRDTVTPSTGRKVTPHSVYTTGRQGNKYANVTHSAKLSASSKGDGLSEGRPTRKEMRLARRRRLLIFSEDSASPRSMESNCDDSTLQIVAPTDNIMALKVSNGAGTGIVNEHQSDAEPPPSLSFLSLPVHENGSSFDSSDEAGSMHEATQAQALQNERDESRCDTDDIPTPNRRKTCSLALSEWKALQETECRDKPVSLFRRAVVDLIVAKNNQRAENNEATSLGVWLPPLLDDDTIIT